MWSSRQSFRGTNKASDKCSDTLLLQLLLMTVSQRILLANKNLQLLYLLSAVRISGSDQPWLGRFIAGTLFRSTGSSIAEVDSDHRRDSHLLRARSGEH